LKNSIISNGCLNIIASNGYLSCINNFTRVTSHSRTCIDHFFRKNVDNEIINSYIFICDITDHYSTILVLSKSYLQNNVKKSSNIIKLNEVNMNHLELLIYTENWHECLDLII